MTDHSGLSSESGSGSIAGGDKGILSDKIFMLVKGNREGVVGAADK